MPDQQHFPLAGQDVDGALNWASEIIFDKAVRAYQMGRTSLGAHQSYTILTSDWRGRLCSGKTKTYRGDFSNGRTIMILVTGASGSVGKEVLRAVAKTGAKHRAMYRSANEAAKAVGTAAVIADFAKPETLGPALADVHIGYPACSPIPELVELESNAI